MIEYTAKAFIANDVRKHNLAQPPRRPSCLSALMSFSRRSSNPAAFASSGSSARATESPAGFWYDQPQHEWVVVLKGTNKLRFEDETIEMRPGDFMNIPAQKKRRGRVDGHRTRADYLTFCENRRRHLVGLSIRLGRQSD
jgi:uncharacterized cupin superfamily protein